MSSKTNTTNAFNSNGMNAYNQMQPQLLQQLQQLAQNPLGSSFFQQQLGMANKNAAQIGQRNLTNVQSNLKTGGGLLSNAGSWLQGQTNNAMLGNSTNQSNAFMSTLNNSLSQRNFALQSMQSYRPLQTGQSSYTSGVGSWLPQAAGAVLNAGAQAAQGMQQQPMTADQAATQPWQGGGSMGQISTGGGTDYTGAPGNYFQQQYEQDASANGQTPMQTN
jgi:hypothetical protein